MNNQGSLKNAKETSQVLSAFTSRDSEPADENYYTCMKSPYGANTFAFTFKATKGGDLKGELSPASVKAEVPLFGCVGELPWGESTGFGSN